MMLRLSLLLATALACSAPGSAGRPSPRAWPSIPRPAASSSAACTAGRSCGGIVMAGCATGPVRSATSGASSASRSILHAASCGRTRATWATSCRWRPPTRPPSDAARSSACGSPTGASLAVTVVRARLAGDGAVLGDLQVLDVGHPDYAAPTTGVVVGDTLFYVATAQLGAIRLAVGSPRPTPCARM
jgi:hypothetical protein